MTPATLRALADRCEAATGDEYDLMVALSDVFGVVKDYARSLDAILSQKPGGARWVLTDGDDGISYADLYDKDDWQIGGGNASTLPLAACAALLRAMAAGDIR